jgi:hypothetical protein
MVRIGTALTDALDELITEGDIPPQLAMRVLQQVHLISFSLFTLSFTPYSILEKKELMPVRQILNGDTAKGR